MEWYQKAAEQGYARAQNNLGLCYKNGDGVEKDIKKAVEWYRKAAEQGDMYAQFNIAEIYYKEMTPHTISRTAAMGAVAAAIPIANIVAIPVAVLGSLGVMGVQINKYMKTADGKAMLNYYRKAAEQGHQKAKEKVKELEGYLKG